MYIRRSSWRDPFQKCKIFWRAKKSIQNFRELHIESEPKKVRFENQFVNKKFREIAL